MLLLFKFRELLAANIIKQRNVAGVEERLQERDGGVKSLFQFTLKAIDNLPRCLHLWKAKVLAYHILLEPGEDIFPRPAHHDMFQNPLANLTGDLLDPLLVLRITPLDSVKPFFQYLEIFFEIRDAGYCGIFRRLKKFELGKNIVDGVVHRRCGHENHLFTPANIEQVGIRAGTFIPETMRLINNDIIKAINTKSNDMIKFPQRLDSGRNPEVMQALFPVGGKRRRTDHQNSSPYLLQQLSGNKGFPQANHVGQKDTIVLV